MAETSLVPAVDELPDISSIVTEDDTPVDNLFSAKQQRLLVEPLYTSWKPGRSFIADANVGVFALHETPVVPDMFLSLDVQPGDDWWAKENRSYFVWKYGKPPEVVVEVVSNTVGEETGTKFWKYARIGVLYYVIFDPQRLLLDEPLTIYELRGGLYVPLQNQPLTKVGLDVTIWDGMYEGRYAQWLRWCDLEGRVIHTGLETSVIKHRFAMQESQRADQENQRADQENQRADQEHQRADQEHQRADQEHQRAEQERQRADQEHQRAERLAEKLKALGISIEE